jgi:hypothetical protein
MRRNILTLILFLGTVPGSFAQPEEIILDKGWKAKRALEVPVDGTVISTREFDLYDWMEAVVPGTVLTTLLHNKKVPDPFFGMNNDLIPDIYETGPEYYTFWFLNRFSVPELEEGVQVWLKFRGINYSANMFLNGFRINSDTHKGMFLREKYLITPYLIGNSTNNLAVLVEPPDPVGNANGGQGGDGTIARSVTMQFTPGWDWICPVRDRNTGIWDQVSLEVTGPVDIRDPYVKPRVPGKRKPGGKQKPAFIGVSAELYNASGFTQEGTLVASINGLSWSVPAKIEAGSSVKVEFDEIEIKNPELWWPVGMGEAKLYNIELSFMQNDQVSDTESFNFGLRETSTYFDEEVGGRVFLINGQKIFIKGGNWIASDMLLRLSPERYETEVRMHAEMNMNMIRIWGGAMPERPEFYEACDKYGLLVWQDLWVSGDCNGRWLDPRKKESQARRQAYPDDHSLFIETAIDQIKMLRNHPSLYMWCGGNEFAPPPDINEQLEKEIFPAYDGTRYYVNESTSESILRNTIGGNGDGPYGIQDPKRFFVTESYPFNPEIGSVGMPNVESMRKMMEEKDLQAPRRDRANLVWRYHKYIGYGKYIEQMGEITGIEDFCKKAQLVNYDQYRALQEGFNAGMWNQYTGMLVWKNQNPWTSLRGQLYDVFLEQNGGFYGFKHGAEPLHVQLNINDSSICVMNQTCFDARNLLVESELFDIHGNSIENGSSKVNVKANTYKISGKLFKGEKPGGFYFARLRLKNNKGELLDENLYWLAARESDWLELEGIRPAELQVSVSERDDGSILAAIENTGKETAFFLRMKISDKKDGKLVLPVFMEDNYITLFPGELRQIGIDLSQLKSEKLKSELQLEVDPWSGGAVKVEL